MTKAIASHGDLTGKKTSFIEIGLGLNAFTAESDPNSGVIIRDDSVMVIAAQATLRLARRVIAAVRPVTDKPISHRVLTHRHAVRVPGADACGAPQVIMAAKARDGGRTQGRGPGLVALGLLFLGLVPVVIMTNGLPGGWGFVEVIALPVLVGGWMVGRGGWILWARR